MGKVSFHFFTSLFSLFLSVVVLINYVGWSGAYISLLGTSRVGWTDSYFGFQSLRTMIGVLDYQYTHGAFTLSGFITQLQNFGQTILFNVPALITKLANTGSINFLDVGKVIFDLFYQPIILLLRGIIILAYLLSFVLEFVSILVMAMSGAFNVPLTNPVPLPTSEILNYRIPVPILV